MPGYDPINLGTIPNDGTGDKLRIAGGKINAQFSEIFSTLLTKENALGFIPEDSANKSQPNGYASLDGSSTVPLAEIPTLPQSKVTNLTTDLAAKENTTNKGSANGYASLDANSKIPVAQLPEIDTFAAIVKYGDTVTQIENLTGINVSYGSITIAPGAQVTIGAGATWTIFGSPDTLPALDVLAPPSDNTNLNVTTSAHGLMPKLPSDSSKFFDGAGNYRTVGQGDVTGLVSSLAGKEATANKGQPNGYASLDSNGKVPLTQLPPIGGAGIVNAKWTVSGNQLTLEQADVSQPMVLTVQKPGTGYFINLPWSSPISLQLSENTVTGSLMNITTSNFGADPDVKLFAYLLVEDVAGTLTPYIGLSRSPMIRQFPGSYIHTNTISARSTVGTPNVEYAIWISKNGTIVGANTSVLCLGQPVSVNLTRADARASAMTAVLAIPRWNDRVGLGFGSADVFVPVFTSGFSVNPSPDECLMAVNGETGKCYIKYGKDVDGTSNATDFVMAPPYTGQAIVTPVAAVTDSGVASGAAGYNGGSGEVSLNGDATGWTNSGSKDLGTPSNLQVWIEYPLAY